MSTHQLARILNAKGIPTPYATRGKRREGMKEELVWQRNTISHILKNCAYYGEYRQFRRATVGRIPGHKQPVKRNTSEDEQVIIPISAIITKDLFEKANKRIAQNKNLATRNNQTSKESLLRGGFAKCAYCGRSLHVKPVIDTQSSGKRVLYFYEENTIESLRGHSIKCELR